MGDAGGGMERSAKRWRRVETASGAVRSGRGRPMMDSMAVMKSMRLNGVVKSKSSGGSDLRSSALESVDTLASSLSKLSVIPMSSSRSA